MDAHFDPNKFHPTFLGNEGHHNPFNITMDSFLQRAHEAGLPADIVEEAASSAWDFFNLVHIPLEINQGEGTSIALGNPLTMADDVLRISTEELRNHGIRDKASLSLICTHEVVHGLTQSMAAFGHISGWQSELISDTWMGIRAAMEDIDLTSVLKSFDNLTDCQSHPGGDLRARHLVEGYELVKELQDKDIPLTFDNLMNRTIASINADESILAREQIAKSTDTMSSSTPHAYSKSELDSLIRQEQNKIDHLNSVIADKSRAMSNKASAGQPFNSEKYAIESARIDLENAIKRKNNLQNTTPSKD